MRILRHLLWLCFILALGSCAFKSMIYEHLDRVALYQIDSYLDLRSDQEKQIEGPIKDTISWIKREKLGEAIEVLQSLEQAATAKKIDQRLIDQVYARLSQWRTELGARLAKPGAQLLRTLDPKQIAHLEKKMTKGNRKLVDLLQEDPEDFNGELEDYAEAQLKRFRYWYGRFTPEQQALYMQTIKLDKSSLELQLEARKKQQKHFIDTIKTQNEESLTQLLEQWGGPDEVGGLEPKHRQHKADSRRRWQDFWVLLHKQLTDEQWQQLQSRLKETRQDLQALGSKSPA